MCDNKKIYVHEINMFLFYPVFFSRRGVVSFPVWWVSCDGKMVSEVDNFRFRAYHRRVLQTSVMQRRGGGR